MKRLKFNHLPLFLIAALLISACKPDSAGNGTEGANNDSTPVSGDWIRIYHPADPDNLHPFNARSGAASFIKENIFMYLSDFDANTMEKVPTLAKGNAEISADGLNYTYEMRPEAKWDNGDPITGYDYEFTLKCIKSPLTDNAHQRGLFSFVKDVKVDPANEKRFTIYTDAPYFSAEMSLSTFEVVSKKFYDPDNVMGKFTVEDFYSKSDELANDSSLIKFSTAFNAKCGSDDISSVYGSGPYKVESWTPGDNVTLVRKKNWWGDQVKEKTWYFQGYADKLIYKTIKDRTTLPAAAKNDELDVIRDMSPDDFVAAREDTAGLIYKHYNFLTPNSFSNIYLGFNCKPPANRKPVVEDVAVRKAIAHLADIDGIIEKIYLGLGTRQLGAVTPLHKDEYHSELKPYEFSVDKAKEVLEAAGWVDGDGNGIREKTIRGKKVELKIEVIISNTSETGPKMVRMIADQAKRAGIQIDANPIDFQTLQTRLREHDFDMCGVGFSANPLPTDLKQVWYSENWANNGSNYFGFGNSTTDSLIDQIRVTLSAEQRKPLYWRFQEIFYDQLPVLMIMAPKERILVHKRFRNATPTELRPGTKPLQFWVPKAEQKFK